jgi:hypothetical protein
MSYCPGKHEWASHSVRGRGRTPVRTAFVIWLLGQCTALCTISSTTLHAYKHTHTPLAWLLAAVDLNGGPVLFGPGIAPRDALLRQAGSPGPALCRLVNGACAPGAQHTRGPARVLPRPSYPPRGRVLRRSREWGGHRPRPEQASETCNDTHTHAVLLVLQENRQCVQ